MDGVTLQSKVWRGYGIAAKRVGLSHNVYRPVGTSLPLASVNLVMTLHASFTSHSSSEFSYGKPSDYKDNLFHGLFDASSVLPGDYLTGPYGIYFVASLDPIKPILCVQCDRTLTFKRAGSISGPGISAAYSGDTAATEVVLASGFPASVIMHAKGLSNIGNSLPMDIGAGSYDVLVPAIPGVLPRPSDIVTDDLGRRFLVDTCEVSALGYRIRVYEAVA